MRYFKGKYVYRTCGDRTIEVFKNYNWEISNYSITIDTFNKYPFTELSYEEYVLECL
jgi:hypothetical protein